MVLYAGSDAPLPRIAWDPGAPAFHVADLDEAVAPVRSHFAHPHVAYVGSHEGCGCGFQLGEHAGFEDPEDVSRKRATLARLADYLDLRLDEGCSIAIYACWSGDESQSPEHRRTLTTHDLRGESFWFLERELSAVVRP